MDLGYSSSSDESDKEDAISKLKRNRETEEKIDVQSIFSLSRPDREFKRQKGDNINDVIKKVLEDAIESESDNDREEICDEEIAVDDLGIEGLPSNAEIKDFNMTEFYRSNQKAIETGELNSKKQLNSGKMKLHRVYNGNIANLQDIMKFNLNNEEKLIYQNNERISKEKANKKEKKG